MLIHENEEGQTRVEFDKPSAFGQFGDDRNSPTASLLDRKLAALVAMTLE